MTEAAKKKFSEFHSNNPEIYQELVALAKQSKKAGHDRIGISMLWDVCRWNRMLVSKGDDESQYKLNDHYKPHYARMIMEQESELQGMFETRRLRSKSEGE